MGVSIVLVDPAVAVRDVADQRLNGRSGQNARPENPAERLRDLLLPT
jgi:hypothetical protein